MFGRDRHDRGALVALGLMLVAIVAVVAITTFGKPSSEPVAPPDTEQVEDEPKGDLAESDPSDFYFLGDGAAQWVMALFSIAATGLSLYAVRLVRSTWHETKRTADAAAVDRRAWLKIVDTDLKPSLRVTNEEVFLRVSFSCTNVGESPARNVRYRAYLLLYPGSWWPSRIENDVPRGTSNERGPVIFPGDTIGSGWHRAQFERPYAREVIKTARQGEEKRGFSSPLVMFLILEATYYIAGDSRQHKTGKGFTVGQGPPLMNILDPFASGTYQMVIDEDYDAVRQWAD